MGDGRDGWYLGIYVRRVDAEWSDFVCLCDFPAGHIGNVEHQQQRLYLASVQYDKQYGTRHVHGWPECQRVHQWMRDYYPATVNSGAILELRSNAVMPRELCTLGLFMQLRLASTCMTTLPLAVGALSRLRELHVGGETMARLPPTVVRWRRHLYKVRITSSAMPALLRHVVQHYYYGFGHWRHPTFGQDVGAYLQHVHDCTARGVFDVVYALYALRRKRHGRRVPRDLMRQLAVRVLETGHEVTWNAVLYDAAQ